jgi:hypothetical protein
MGQRQSKNERPIDLDRLKEEVSLAVIVQVSAELNHSIFEHEARIAKHDEQIMELKNDVRLLRTSLLMHAQEIKVLHETKKNMGPGKMSQLRSLIYRPKIVPQNNSDKVS